MSRQTPLIATIFMGLVYAFIFGAVAHRLKIFVLVGYLVAGILVGPFIPGFAYSRRLASIRRSAAAAKARVGPSGPKIWLEA